MLSLALTILSDNFCTIAFQLLIFQKEFASNFSKNLQKILTLIKITRFRLIIVKSRIRQIRFNSIDLNLNFFFSFNWVIDKILMRATIKQFLANIAEFRRNFQKSKEFEEVTSQSFTSTSAKERFLQIFFAFIKHIRNDNSSTKKIFIIWSTISKFDHDSSISAISIQEQFSNNVLLHFDLITNQMQTLSDIIIVTVNTKINRLNNELRQFLQAFVLQQTLRSEQTSKHKKTVDYRSSKN